jgi:hypothetical protein
MGRMKILRAWGFPLTLLVAWLAGFLYALFNLGDSIHRPPPAGPVVGISAR